MLPAPEIYLIDSHVLSTNEISLLSSRTARQTYLTYCADLFSHHHLTFDRQNFSEQRGINYKQLALAWLARTNKLGFLNKLDCLIGCSWIDDFDPNYSHFLTAMADEYPLPTLCYDVCDVLNLAPFLALQLMLKHFQQQHCQKALILCLEHNCLPSIKCDQSLPELSTGVVGLLFSRLPFPSTVPPKNSFFNKHWQLIGSWLMTNHEDMTVLTMIKNYILHYSSIENCSKKNLLNVVLLSKKKYPFAEKLYQVLKSLTLIEVTEFKEPQIRSPSVLAIYSGLTVLNHRYHHAMSAGSLMLIFLDVAFDQLSMGITLWLIKDVSAGS